MRNIDAEHPLAIAVTKAIHDGDISGLGRLLAEDDGLAKARIIDARGGSRTLLHIATDWPGHFPNGARTVAALIAAGADPNEPRGQKIDETPLHWAASSDDVEVMDALLGLLVRVPRRTTTRGGIPARAWCQAQLGIRLGRTNTFGRRHPL